MKRKKGKIRSVGVQPFHSACSERPVDVPPVAGVVHDDHRRHGRAAEDVERHEAGGGAADAAGTVARRRRHRSGRVQLCRYNRREASYVLHPFDAVLWLAFGGPQGPADVRPFLANVLRGRRVRPPANRRGGAPLRALRRRLAR